MSPVAKMGALALGLAMVPLLVKACRWWVEHTPPNSLPRFRSSSYPYHHSEYYNFDGSGLERLPCKHCKPGQPCAEYRGTFEPHQSTDATTFVQWKGTNVCVDVYCGCGYHGHFDGDFAYFVRCPDCGAVYEMGTQLKLRRLADDELEWLCDDPKELT